MSLAGAILLVDLPFHVYVFIPTTATLTIMLLMILLPLFTIVLNESTASLQEMNGIVEGRRQDEDPILQTCRTVPATIWL